ncbi:MAG TPA: hypothetical protein DFR83_29110 [Deltaproteobacteria bacterium]|nr:hypothetical protein [Deltaproteobacteria bacterium]
MSLDRHREPSVYAGDGTPPEALMRLSSGPPGLQVTVKDGVLMIRRHPERWRWSRASVLLGVYALVWIIGLVCWNSQQTSLIWMELHSGFLAPAVSLVVFLLPFLALFFAAAQPVYLLACRVLTPAVLRVDSQLLRFNSGPLLAAFVPSLDVSCIDQIYVDEGSPTRTPEGAKQCWSTGRFHVMARLEGGATQCIFDGLSDKAHALYIEKRVEAFLGIVNVPVNGACQD